MAAIPVGPRDDDGDDEVDQRRLLVFLRQPISQLLEMMPQQECLVINHMDPISLALQIMTRHKLRNLVVSHSSRHSSGVPHAGPPEVARSWRSLFPFRKIFQQPRPPPTAEAASSGVCSCAKVVEGTCQIDATGGESAGGGNQQTKPVGRLSFYRRATRLLPGHRSGEPKDEDESCPDSRRASSASQRRPTGTKFGESEESGEQCSAFPLTLPPEGDVASLVRLPTTTTTTRGIAVEVRVSRRPRFDDGGRTPQAGEVNNGEEAEEAGREGAEPRSDDLQGYVSSSSSSSKGRSSESAYNGGHRLSVTGEAGSSDELLFSFVDIQDIECFLMRVIKVFRNASLAQLLKEVRRRPVGSIANLSQRSPFRELDVGSPVHALVNRLMEGAALVPIVRSKSCRVLRVISARDFINILERQKLLNFLVKKSQVSVQELLKTDLEVLLESSSLLKACSLMERSGYSGIPIVSESDPGNVVDFITVGDLRYMSFAEEMLGERVDLLNGRALDFVHFVRDPHVKKKFLDKFAEEHGPEAIPTKSPQGLAADVPERSGWAFVKEGTSLDDLISLFLHDRAQRLILVNDKSFAMTGLVTLHDFTVRVFAVLQDLPVATIGGHV